MWSLQVQGSREVLNRLFLAGYRSEIDGSFRTSVKTTGLRTGQSLQILQSLKGTGKIPDTIKAGSYPKTSYPGVQSTTERDLKKDTADTLQTASQNGL